MSDATPASSPDGSPSGPSADAAAQALKAAQAAISAAKAAQGDGPAATAVAPGPAEDVMAAAQAAIAQAKAMNEPPTPVAAATAPAPSGRTTVASPLDLPRFGGSSPASRPEGIDLLADVNLNVKIELGRTRMLVEDVLRLGEGSVVELDKLAGDPVDVYVNERHVARGEVLVLNDNFCVRINEIVADLGDEAA